MLRSRLRLRAPDGFTLVEVLVVVLITGILAAVALATFLNQRAKAQDADAKTSVTTAAKAITVWNTEHGTYAGATPAKLQKIEPSLLRAPGLAVDGDLETFTVTVDSAAGGAFSIERRDTGVTVRTCSDPGRGACLDIADGLGNRW